MIYFEFDISVSTEVIDIGLIEESTTAGRSNSNFVIFGQLTKTDYVTSVTQAYPVNKYSYRVRLLRPYPVRYPTTMLRGDWSGDLSHFIKLLCDRTLSILGLK